MKMSHGSHIGLMVVKLCIPRCLSPINVLAKNEQNLPCRFGDTTSLITHCISQLQVSLKVDGIIIQQ